MNQLRVGVLVVVLLSFLPGFLVHGQEPKKGLQDELLDQLAGDWKLTRKIRGGVVENKVHAQWVLNHQFLQLHMVDVKQPPAYQAMVMIGYDRTRNQYVAHWFDILGGQFSRTLGFGSRSGNSIKFVFEYPDGPFHNTFTFDPAAKTWNCLMEQKDRNGKWTVFAQDRLEKSR